MSIRYLPTRMLKKMAPKKAVEKLVKGNLSLNKTALNFVSKSDVVSKSEIENVALKVIKSYKKRYAAERKEGASKSEAIDDALNDKKLMVNRVQNEVVFQVKESIHDEYYGEYYEWLPSDAEEPDPVHQLKYGVTFQIGKGEMPGDRYGCRCGMNILVDETKLAL